ncbi:MAG: MCE family protein [Betaproteobacteria bacterium]|nr:MAG: MCE family protein [Betaproteobacteria bacterium]
MTDPHLPPPASSPVPEARVEPPRRFRIPLVWIIPLVAALIGLFLAGRAWYQQGPVITLQFKSGAGLEAGKTRIKYKDVDVGLITALALSEDASTVIATAQFPRDAARLLVEDTRFWVVSARVSGGTVSGLGTLLSGAYVGMDVGKSSESRRDFVALAEPPVVALDVPGRSFVLHAETLGSINVGTPVYFRRIEAGQVTGFRLDDSGRRLDIRVFIKAPYDRFVTRETRFWDVSGVDVKLSAEGIQVNSESVTSVMAGGLAFRSPEDGEGDDVEPAPAGHAFHLFRTQDEAMRKPQQVVETYLLRFSESVRGLSVGAPVSLRGITVGEVKAIDVDFDAAATDLGLLVEVDLYPRLLRPRAGVPDMAQPPSSRRVLDRMIANGLRAQLRSGNLVTGQLYVALDFFADAPRAAADWSQTPPRLPTTKGSLEELQATLGRVMNKLDKLPIEQIGGDVRQALARLARTLEQTEALMRRVDGLMAGDARETLATARATLEEVQGVMANGRKLLSSDSPMQQDLRLSLQELGRAAQALRELTDALERNPEAVVRGKPDDQP